jgi:hypothetical protein
MPSVRARKPTGSVFMAKRTRTLPPTSSGPARPSGRPSRPGINLPQALYEGLREAAFRERCKIHDIVLEGIEMALRKRGYPTIEGLRAKYERKTR